MAILSLALNLKHLYKKWQNVLLSLYKKHAFTVFETMAQNLVFLPSLHLEGKRPARTEFAEIYLHPFNFERHSMIHVDKLLL